MPTILDLPVELCILIVSDLSPHDLAAMRLTHRVFTAPAASFLFRRVVMSRLKQDRDALEQIAASEHLACYVRELVWQELNLEAWFKGASDASDWGPTQWTPVFRRRGWQAVSDDYDLIKQLITDAAYDDRLFWLPRMEHKDLLVSISQSLSWFIGTLHKFPRLTAFVSCRMPQERLFTYKGYPIQPDVYQRRLFSNTSSSSIGFFSYMLEAMIHAPSKIQSLTWHDENIHRDLRNKPLRKYIPAFNSLTAIDLRPTGLPKEWSAMIVSYLKAATNLERLTLSFGSDHRKGPSILVNDMVKRCDWPSLTSLEFADASFPRSGMIKFLKKCISLRHLVFRDCSVRVLDIFKLRRAAISQLTSIVITGGSHQFLESSLLDFVNKSSSSLADLDGESIRAIPVENTIHTEKFTRDDHLTFTHTGNEGEYPYTEAEDEQEETYWSWGRVGLEREIYYWPVDNADEAKSGTTIWHFKRRNGQQWYGDGDPLEYLSDWDSDAGDEATQVPGGEEFMDFCRSSPANSGAVPTPKAILTGLMTKASA